MYSDSPFPSLSSAARRNLLADNFPVGTAYVSCPYQAASLDGEHEKYPIGEKSTKRMRAAKPSPKGKEGSRSVA